MTDIGAGTLTVDPNTNRVRVSSINSGIDTEALTEALYEAKKLPALRIEQKIEVNEAKVAAYQDLRSALTSMQTAIEGLRNPPGLSGVENNLFERKAAYFTSSTSTDPMSLLGIQATNRADVGSFDLRIDSLASAHKVMSATFATADEQLAISGPETLTVQLGSGTSADIAVTADMDVYDLRDAINVEAQTTGVQASVLKVADGDFRLVLTGQDTGSGNDIALSGAPETIARLNVSDLATAEDAELYVDNVQVFRPTNTITDLFDGLTIDLYQAPTDGTTVTVDIEPDLSSARDAVLNFADAYNGLREFIDGQNAISDEGAVDDLASPLFGDTLLRTLNQELGFALGGAVNGLPAGSITTLGELGISIDDDNMLTVDTAVLDEKLLADPDAVRRVFEFNAQASDPNLIVYDRTNTLASSNFTIEKLGDGSWQLTDGTNTVALEVDGTSLTAPAGSAYAGLSMFWVGGSDPAGPIDVTATQGIADRLYNIIEEAADDIDGSIEQAIATTREQTEGWREDVARIESRAEDYRLMLVEKFARLETALSLSESMLNQIRAQTDAMNSDG